MTSTLARCIASALATMAVGTASAQTAPAAAASAVPEARFTLTRVSFTPTVAVPPADLQKAVQPFIGRPMGTAELNDLSTAIRRLYEDRGFGLVGIGFPSQGLTEGVLQVALVEPKATQLVVENANPPITDERTKRVLNGAGVRSGQPLNLLQLDRAMYTLNDWPGVKAKATLTPSGDEGRYNVAVQTEARRAWDASVDIDNHGTEVSGKYRAGALLRWNNPTGTGDNLDLRLVLSQGSGNLVGRLSYETPLGASPWRGAIGYSRVNYELAGTFAGAEGTADVFDASVSYPLLRSRDRNIIGRLAYEDKTLIDGFSSIDTDKKIRGATLQFSFESRDAFFGGGYNGGSLSFMRGNLTNRSTGTGALFTDATALGSFTKVSAQATRLQALTSKLSLFTGLSGQWASQNLDNAEKLTLGGARGVRGYPSAEGASDQGAIFNVELRWWVDPQWSTFVFHDAARGRRQHSPNAGGRNHLSLHASGLGVQYTNPDLFTLKATLGVRGDEPVVSDTDSTGRSLLLVQLQHSF